MYTYYFLNTYNIEINEQFVFVFHSFTAIANFLQAAQNQNRPSCGKVATAGCILCGCISDPTWQTCPLPSTPLSLSPNAQSTARNCADQTLASIRGEQHGAAAGGGGGGGADGRARGGDPSPHSTGRPRAPPPRGARLQALAPHRLRPQIPQPVL